jgi:hypothetical protein
MQLRHISPRSSDWVDAMDGGGRGWEKLGPEERMKLRQGEQGKDVEFASVWGRGVVKKDDVVDRDETDDYGWGDGSASR